MNENEAQDADGVEIHRPAIEDESGHTTENSPFTPEAEAAAEQEPIVADAPKIILPNREQMKTQMESLIHHFKIVTEGFAVPAGEATSSIEAPHGMMNYYVVSDGTAKPYRVHMRNADFANLQALETMCKGRLIADVVAVIGSIDIVLGAIDR